jgi:3-phosphoshikimate 1-carboxyvinyltransferase
LNDIAHARVKESNRISDLRHELLKTGAHIEERDDAMIIHPYTDPPDASGVVLSPHSDHRLAMAFMVLGLMRGCTVEDVECVRKSYPDFVDDLKSLSAHLIPS